MNKEHKCPTCGRLYIPANRVRVFKGQCHYYAVKGDSAWVWDTRLINFGKGWERYRHDVTNITGSSAITEVLDPDELARIAGTLPTAKEEKK